MKKYIILAILTFIISVWAVAVHAEEGTEEKVYGLLTAMNVIKERDIENADKIITRGEFAAMAAKLVPYSMEYTANEQKYSDVPADSSRYNDIMLLTQMNVLRGVSAIKFEPDSNIAFNDACAVMVRLLGYSSPEDGNYQYQAGIIGVLDDVSATDGQLTGKDAMRMMYNALFTEIKFGNSIDGYMPVTDFEILMEKRFDVYEIEGVLTDDGVTSIVGESSVGRDNVIIDNILYVNKSANVPLPGSYVEGFVKRDNGETELIYMYSPERKNQIIEFTDDFIESYANGVYNVYVNEDKRNTKRYNLAEDYKLVYNTKALHSSITQDEFDKMLKPEFGNVTLIDNNNDDKFDVVIAESFETVVVKGYDKDSEAIYNRHPAPEFISFKDIKNVDAENSDGIYMEITSIEKNNVVSVMKSADGSYARMIISTEKASGILNSVTEDNEYITVGEKTYEMAPDLLKYMTIPAAGCKVNIYIRHDGRVAFIESTTGGSGKYAYLHKVYIDEDMDEKTCVSIYTEDNEIKRIPLAESVIIDGKRYKEHAEAYSYIKNHPYALHNLILVKINDKDEVTNIDCAYFMNDKNGYNVPSDGEDVKTLHVAHDRYNINGSVGWILGNVVGVSEETKIFVIPSDRGDKEYTSMTDADFENVVMSQIKISNINAGDISNGSAYPHTAYIRDDSTMTVEAIVLYRNVAGWDINITYNADTRPVAVVTDVVKTVSADNEIRYKITYTTGTGYSQVYTATENGIKCRYEGTEVKIGDIIKYGTDKSGRIPDNQLVIMYSPSRDKDNIIFADGEFIKGRVPSLSGQYTYGLLKGQVYEMNDKFIRILRDNNTKRLVSLATMKYIVYDESNRQTVSFGDWSDISTVVDVGEAEATKIVFDWSDTNIRFAYIIK